MPNIADKSKEKSIDLQNFSLRTDLYKRIPKVVAPSGRRRRRHPNGSISRG